MNILIFRTGSIGDIVITIPILKKIREHYKDDYISFLTNFPDLTSPKTQSSITIIDGLYLVDDFIQYPNGNLSLKNLYAVYKKIRTSPIDILFYLMPTRRKYQIIRDHLFFKICGVKKIVGISIFNDDQINKYNISTGLWDSEFKRLSNPVSEFIGVDIPRNIIDPLNLSIYENDLAKVSLSELNHNKFMAFCLGTKVPANHWGWENWFKLVSILHEKFPDNGIVFIGSSDEYNASQLIIKILNIDGINLCGKLSPRISAAVINLSSLYLGHDSGPMHIADILEKPLVAIFSGRNKPGIWFPYNQNSNVIYRKTDCFGCGLKSCVIQEMKCIKSISIQDVISAVSSLY